MQTIRQEFRAVFQYDVHFTEGVFRPDNDLLVDTLEAGHDPLPRKVLVVVDHGLLKHHPGLLAEIDAYLEARDSIERVHPHVVVPGGEAAKNDPRLVEHVQAAIHAASLCRHSYVIAVGGGSVIDLAGFAASTAHRGIRLVRIPTTVLSQNDSAVGVKNGINAFGTKNFLGSFAPPYAVVNDVDFLKTLEDRDWRAGISEAVKVALLKDADFFRQIESQAERLAPPSRDLAAMRSLVFRCAELHLEHIATSGDPFESGSSRPLDFGHWAAHQLEQLTRYELRHGEAVAVGIALDTTYSYLSGLVDKDVWQRVLGVFDGVGFDLYVPELEEHISNVDHPRCIFQGLEAFREHLGGELTIMLLEDVGRGREVHEVDLPLYREAAAALRKRTCVSENAA